MAKLAFLKIRKLYNYGKNLQNFMVEVQYFSTIFCFKPDYVSFSSPTKLVM